MALLGAAAITAGIKPAAAALLWNWNYSGPDIKASGTFTTDDTPDSSGFYLITGITGTRNGERITGLQPTGAPIPGNEPYAVDNLVSISGGQLTHKGFGYVTANGNYANPFFADYQNPPKQMEFFSAPPFAGGAGPGDSELSVSFSATPVTSAEPLQ